MRSHIFLAAAIIIAAIVAVRAVDQRAESKMHPAQLAVATPAPPPVRAGAAWGDEIRITAGPDRQFYVKADVNRRPARFLVDTGASYVALRDSDAREAGIYTSWTDYTYPVHTANGETKAAFVTIDEIEIGGLRVEGVRAFILQDDQLNINLLGMSFLSRLESVEARKGELVLRG